MAQALPIFMEASSPQGETALDGSVLEVGPSGEEGLFVASLTEALATLPQQLGPGSAVDFFVSTSVVEIASQPNTNGQEGSHTLDEKDSPQTWENGCQVELAMNLGSPMLDFPLADPESNPAPSSFTPLEMPIVERPTRALETVTPEGPVQLFNTVPNLSSASKDEAVAIAPSIVSTVSLPVLQTELPVPVKSVDGNIHPTLKTAETPLTNRTQVVLENTREPGLVWTDSPRVKEIVSTNVNLISPFRFQVAEKDLSIPDFDRMDGVVEELPEAADAPKSGERFTDFFQGESENDGREKNPQDSKSFPDWEISLREVSARTESIQGHSFIHESVKTPDPNSSTGSRTTLPLLPNLLFQRLVETSGEMVRSASRHQEFVVQVEPEHLGRVQVAVEVHQGRIAARIAVDSEAVRQAMDAQLPALKQALEQQGLRLESIEVSVQDRHASLLNPEGRDSESFFHQRRSGGRGETGEPELFVEAESEPGETGRRFGFNTVEYFA